MIAVHGAPGAVSWILAGGERATGNRCCLPSSERWWWWRRAAGEGVNGWDPRPVAVRARLPGFFSSKIGLDSQTFQAQDSAHMLYVGPIPGDIAEVEAYCRIFRVSEQLHTSIMETLCNSETGECGVLYDDAPADVTLSEEKVASALGCLVALLNKGREAVLSGRSSFTNSFRISDIGDLDGNLPPLASFRREMRLCCNNLQVALANYLVPSDPRSICIWQRLHRLKNVSYDLGFPRRDGSPCPSIIANWSPVYFSSRKDDIELDNPEVAFWKGSHVINDGLAWLVDNGFKTIVDLRKGAPRDELYESAIGQAITSGKLTLVHLPIEVGTAPSMEQVEQFASLVSDISRRPLYLCSQEGIGRTSAMVSRWRQYTMHFHRNTTANLSNGKLSKNISEEKNLDSEVTVFLESGEGNHLCDRDSHSHDEVHSDFDLIPDVKCRSKLSAPQVGVQNRHAVHEIYYFYNNSSKGISESEKSDPDSKISWVDNPLKAQFPDCNIFSRKEVSQFFRKRNVSYRTRMGFLKKKPFSDKPVHSNVSTSDAPLSILTTRKSSNTMSTGDGVLASTDANISDIGRQIREQDVLPSGVSVNGFFHRESDDVSAFPITSNKVVSSLSRKTLSTTAGVVKVKQSTDSNGFYADNIEVHEGDICASTTGVVRVQSRRKAEMFLVRTDGFSCTREKVTESSLAFTHPSTQQQMLMWKSPPKTVLLLKKLGMELMEEAKEVASFLHHQEKMNVLVEPDVHDIFARIPGFGFVQTFYTQDTSDLHERVDFVACLGGDGVILHASNLFRGAVPPVVSFNLGSLGFLTSHTFEDYKQDLRAVIHGSNTLDGVYITLRMRLRCEIFRNGKAVPGKVFDVLNEVVVDRGSNPYLSKIECYEHDRLITKVQGDGVIVATPTGSTAYSTAAGGSMVHPNVPCMLFTPICPHSLSFRPVILPDSARLELKIPEDTRSNAWVSFDGKRRQQLSRGDSVCVWMSKHPLPTVNKSDQTGDWFLSLIRCLNWNERLDQKAL